jgi:hypothetical protein
MQTQIHHSLSYLVAFLFLVALMFALDRLVLMLWMTRLNRHRGQREGNHEDNGSGECWRMHRKNALVHALEPGRAWNDADIETYSASIAIAWASTSAPRAMSAGEENSSGRWL